MDDKNRNLVTRISSAAILLPTVLAVLYIGGVWAALLMALAAGICTGEYYLITLKTRDVGTVMGVGASALLPLLPVLYFEHMAEAAYGVVAATFLAAWIHGLWQKPISEAPTRAAHLLTGVVYGGVGIYALSALRIRDDGLQWIVVAMTVTWANDTLAYFAGRFFGRHKLSPEVSPNKTWEGFIGGWVGSIAGLFVARAAYAHSLTVLDCLVLGAVGGVLGPLGDLCESLLKRAYGVKDSSRLIPGHGGLLDRVDALLFNAPWVFVYVCLVRKLWEAPALALR